jgi:hypothetical protein
MFVLTTVHASKSPFYTTPYGQPNELITPVINLWRTYTAFVDNIDTPNGPVIFLSTLKSWHQITKGVLYVIVSLIGDGVAVWLGVPELIPSVLRTAFADLPMLGRVGLQLLCHHLSFSLIHS